MTVMEPQLVVAGYVPVHGPRLPHRELAAPESGRRGRHLALTPETIAPLLEGLQEAALHWGVVPLAECAQAVADAAEQLRRPEHPGRRAGLAACAAWTGRAEGMLADSLDFFLGKLQRDTLLEEAGRCGLRRGADEHRAEAPALVLHWLAGNTPWAGLESLVAAALAGSSSLVKVARAEPVFASVFAQSLATAHPVLATALTVVSWDGALDTALDERLFPACDAVVAFGSDATVRSLQARAARAAGKRGPRFVAHGHRLSAILLGEDAWRPETLERTAAGVALDHVLEDQTGCLSPRAVLLVGDSKRAADNAFALAERIAAALEQWERRWPRSPIPAAEAVRVQQVRESRRMRGAGLWSPPDTTAWTVLLDAVPAGGAPFEPAPEARFVQLLRCASLDDAIRSLLPARGVLSTLACDGWVEAPAAVGAVRRALAPDRLCSPGTMQRPPLGWNHDGASDLALLLGQRAEPAHDRH